MTTKPVILVIDVGSSSTRAIFFDSAAQSIPGAVSQIPVSFNTTTDGGVTVDAGVLFSKIVESIDQLLKTNPNLATNVLGVASDTFVGNILGVDRDYQPITPVYTYADTRNAADVTELKSDLGVNGATEAHQRTATLLHTSYAPARLKWVERTEPELYRKVEHWITFGEYLLWRLFGKKGTSFSVASWNGLLNFKTLEWDKDWLSYLNIKESQLSPLTDLDKPLVGLKSPWAERWQALKGVPWFPTIGDGAAANIGSGCDNPDRIALTLGTTGAMRVVLNPSTVEKIPAGLWCYRVDRNRCLLGGATTEGGNLFAWMSRTLQLPPADQVEKELATAAPCAHGLSILPFVAGERAPGWNENAKANIQGITLNTKPIEIVQAGLESVAYRFAVIYQRIFQHLPKSTSRQIVVGGGSMLGSPAWTQIFADVLGEPLITLLEKENTSRGLALLALEKLGLIQKTSDLAPELGTVFKPNLKNHQIHKAAIEKQVEIYNKIYS
jgi:gluconokinase